MEKTCFITGANSGIGKAAAIRIAQQGCRVIIGCRNHEREIKALEDIREKSNSTDVELVGIDLSSQESIKSAAGEYKEKYKTIDVLIHNAADFDISRKEPLYSPENIETVWATNHIGPVLLTDLFLPELRNSPQGRVITVASQGLTLHPFLKINLADPEFRKSGFSVARAYYQSKLAQVMYTYWLAEKLKGTNITVNCVRVTNVKIDIERFPKLSPLMKFMYSIKSIFSISPDEMAKIYALLALSEQVSGVTGKYFDENGKIVKSSSLSMDTGRIEELMKVTFNYIKK